MNTTRIVRTDITALRSMNNLYLLNKGQYFVETNKAYEVWGMLNGLEYRFGRVAKKAIYWVIQDPEFAYGGEANPESNWIRPQ